MGKITCQGVEDTNDPLDCLDEDWNGTNMCRYCADIDEHAKGMALLTTEEN
jgi:hypothetical protein